MNGKFHCHLRDTFAPQVVRYVDLMESSLAQSIHKGFEKEKWEIKGKANLRPIKMYTIVSDKLWFINIAESAFGNL